MYLDYIQLPDTIIKEKELIDAPNSAKEAWELYC